MRRSKDYPEAHPHPMFSNGSLGLDVEVLHPPNPEVRIAADLRHVQCFPKEDPGGQRQPAQAKHPMTYHPSSA